ncbi:hypothetical protein KXX29_007992 [Aspergillus fumigatus]|nr:hypothetical protein KXX29_007992 [Aspergillus fumigatus]
MASDVSGSDKERLEAEAKVDNDRAIKMLENGELKGKTTVILILGSTGAGKTNVTNLLANRTVPVGSTLEPGTEISRASLETINGKKFLFIDTPGFGHVKMSNEKVRQAIYTLLGHFTRWIGGIHGVLYLQDIRADRENPGMKESFEFLDELTQIIRPPISFITTKWDTVAMKEFNKLIAREEELKEYWRKKFQVGDRDVFHCEASCFDDFEYMEPKRQELIGRIFERYSQAKLVPLDMPFWEWTKLDKAKYVGSIPFIVVGTVLEEVSKGIGRAEIRFEFHIG